jgi:hydroxyethylthiazole kinase-like uncharacterized protein yjeF
MTQDMAPDPGRMLYDDLNASAVAVDALFGAGLNRCAPFFEPLSWILHRGFNDGIWWFGDLRPPYFVAVDVPSGLCADSGRELSDQDGGLLADPYAAHLTVTFHRPKIGHVLAEGPRLSGKVRVVDLGLDDPMTLDGIRSRAKLVDAPEVLSPLSVADLALHKPITSHKFTHGHALILSGPPGKGGAARLAARGALRVGAGLVTLGCPPEARAENAARLDAVMLAEVAGAEGLAAVLADARINAICLGPGLPVDGQGAALVAGVLASGRGGANGGILPPYGGGGVVLDAGALTLLGRDPALMARLTPGCILTPHGGEFARLFPDIAERLAAPPTRGPAYSKVDATRAAAKRAGCVVLYKGPDTVIAAPDGQCLINAATGDRAAPWLATAGSGDVLAGIIAGLLARGFASLQAAATGAWLHVEAAHEFGPGLIAEDLPEMLPRVFRRLFAAGDMAGL